MCRSCLFSRVCTKGPIRGKGTKPSRDMHAWPAPRYCSSGPIREWPIRDSGDLGPPIVKLSALTTEVAVPPFSSDNPPPSVSRVIRILLTRTSPATVKTTPGINNSLFRTVLNPSANPLLWVLPLSWRDSPWKALLICRRFLRLTPPSRVRMMKTLALRAC